jgi:hypothetical protein
MIAGKICTYLAVSLDSIGYEEYYTMLFKVLGLEYNKVICHIMHHSKFNKILQSDVL